MVSGFGELTGMMPSSPSFLGSNNANDADAIVYGTTSAFPHAFNIVHGGYAQGFPQPIAWGQ
ncbi:hypothetical protein Gorai_019176 [Gossypium raimondii]|uniref:Uncharacterized protein n=1 Tax=Gossypium raimondii TaxID=29730 RepID=A0A7J8PMF3_GOSRA|nr:hypothetical protein [Gossypium raimondii]